MNMKAPKKHHTKSKKQLYIIIGAEMGLLEERTDKSFATYDPYTQDILFIGTDKEQQRFKIYCKNFWPDVWRLIKGKIAYCNRLSTWSGLEYSRPYWKKYPKITLYLEAFYALRVARFFNQLGRNTGISTHYFKSFDSPIPFILNHMESTRERILFLSIIAEIFRRYSWIWGSFWIQKLLVQKHPRDFMPWDFLVTKKHSKI